MIEIYEYNNHIMIHSEYSEPLPHRHAAAHAFLSKNTMQVQVGDATYSARGIVIPSGLVHAADNKGQPVLVFLFDESTKASEFIKRVQMLPDELVDLLFRSFGEYETNGRNPEDYSKFIQELYQGIGIDDSPREIQDERIQAAIYYINQRIGTKITCGEVASAVFMSESRFSHLFREEMGITFAGFLQMRQLSYAYYLIIQGMSVTEAAIASGFSSSSHFAATHKRVFGLCATDISSEVAFYKIK